MLALLKAPSSASTSWVLVKLPPLAEVSMRSRVETRSEKKLLGR